MAQQLKTNSEIVSDKAKNPVTTSEYIKHGDKWLDEELESTKQHNSLTGRNAANAHPIDAITGLQDALDGKIDLSDLNYVTPQMFGAKGDNIADDTEAFKNAINTGKKVVIPNGRYKISETLILKNGQFFVGCGYENSKIYFTGTDVCIRMSNYAHVEYLYFQHNSNVKQNYGTDSTAKCIESNGFIYTVVENCRIYGFDHGIRFGSNSWCSRAVHNYIERCNTGISGSGEFNGIELNNNIVTFCVSGIELGSGRNVTISNTVIETSQRGIWIRNRNLVSIQNCYFENNRDSAIDVEWGSGGVTHVDIEGCSFFTSNTYSDSIISYNIANDTVFTISKCWFTHNPSVEVNLKCLKNTRNDKTGRPKFTYNTLDAGYEVGELVYTDNTTMPEAYGAGKSLNDIPTGYFAIQGAIDIPEGQQNTGYCFTYTMPGALEGLRKLQVYYTYTSGRCFFRYFNIDTWSKWFTVATS